MKIIAPPQELADAELVALVLPFDNPLTALHEDAPLRYAWGRRASAAAGALAPALVPTQGERVVLPGLHEAPRSRRIEIFLLPTRK